MSHPNRRARPGFSLIEVLVVISIIAVLMSLLMVSVNQARNVAMRLKCANNLHQLGVACVVYHDTMGAFPTENGPPSMTGAPSASFYIALLEYMEMSNVANAKAWDHPVSLFVCPARRSTQSAPAKRCYVYVKTQGAILNTPGGANLSTIANSAGSAFTALLGHEYMEPGQYNGGKDWKDAPNSVAGANAQKDGQASAGGSGGGGDTLGGPHPNVMPVLFADTHVSNIPYNWNQARGGQDFWTRVFDWTNNKPLVFPGN